MYKIKRNGVVTNIGPDQEWLERHIEMGSFGKPEQTITHVIVPAHDIQVESSPATFSEDGTLLQEAVFETVHVPDEVEIEVIPAEFTVEYFDETIPTQEQINAEAKAFLFSTDWYVTRWMEKGIAIPQEISEQRDAARLRVQ